MNRKIASAVMKEVKARLELELPGFQICAEDAFDKKHFTGGEAFFRGFGKRFGYFMVLPYPKSYNEFAVITFWSPKPNEIKYCRPVRAFQFELYWKEHGFIPEEFAECEIDLSHLMMRDGRRIRSDNLWKVDVSQEEIASKEKLALAVKERLDELFPAIREYAYPLFESEKRVAE